MALKFRKKVLLAKIEDTYGTDSEPTGAANAIRTANLSITPLEAETAEQNLDDPKLGSELQTHFGVHVVMEFDVPLAGAGTAGEAPNYGPLLRACGRAETIDVGVDVQYDPVSEDEESVSVYMWIDGQKHAMIGARGAESIRFERGFVFWHFRFVGLWVDPESVAMPTPDWSGWQNPVVMSNANTTFSLHTTTPNMISTNFNSNNEVVYREVVGDESVQIIDRAPGGSVVIEAPALSDKNWFTTAKANTTGALSIVHGTAAGNIVELNAGKVQMLNPNYGEDNGITTLEMDMNIIPDAGDDDWKVTIK